MHLNKLSKLAQLALIW